MGANPSNSGLLGGLFGLEASNYMGIGFDFVDSERRRRMFLVMPVRISELPWRCKPYSSGLRRLGVSRPE